MTDINDMLKTIVPKSNQLNSDDLVGGRTITIKITKVSIAAGDQPVALSYEGDGGKPYMPGKSMRRVIVNCWGSDANLYVGRSMTLYRDDKVMFGGVAVGGIRISHISDISEQMTMALTVTRANKKPFTVKPLVVAQPKPPIVTQPEPPIDPEKLKTEALAAAEKGTTQLLAFWGGLKKPQQVVLKSILDSYKVIAAKVDEKLKQSEGCSDEVTLENPE